MKKVKIVLSFILCFILFVGAPSTAYANTSSVKNVDILVQDSNGEKYAPTVRVDNVSIPYYAKSSGKQIFYHSYSIGQSDSIKLDDGDIITVTISLNHFEQSRYKSWEISGFEVLSAYGDYFDSCDTGDGRGFYDPSTSTLTYTTTVDNVGDYCWVNWYGLNPTLSSYDSSITLAFGVTDFTIDVKSEQSGFFDKVSDFFQGLFDKLTAWFDSLFQWLKDIRDNASEGFSNIGNWFTELGNKIKSFFTELGNNIKEQFTNMINNLKSFFADVGQWFKDIGDKIGEFFEKLWNRIWWGNENGESEYQKPVINNKLNDILDTLNGYQLQLKNTIDTISSAADSVSTYISTGTQLVNGIINVAGVGFTALIVFAIVFVLARKVVGR